MKNKFAQLFQGFPLMISQSRSTRGRNSRANRAHSSQGPGRYLLKYPLKYLLKLAKLNQARRQARRQTRRQTPRRSRELFLFVSDSSDGLGRDLSGGPAATPAALL